MQSKQFSSLDHSPDYGDPMVTRILDATEQCIQRFGIRRTSMGEVARVGKLSRGSIYRHFKDKDSLVTGLFKRHQDLYLNRIESQLEAEPTLVDKLTRSVISGRKDMNEGIFASLAEVEPETVAMMFLRSRVSMAAACRFRLPISVWRRQPVRLAPRLTWLPPQISSCVSRCRWFSFLRWA